MIDGTPTNASRLERQLVDLIRKTCERPARLAPADLDPLRTLVGDGALDYTLSIGMFHYINRIADLLGLGSQVLPKALRRFELLRRLGVRLAAMLLARMDLANREYRFSYEQALDDLAPVFEQATGRRLTDEVAALRARPKLIEALRLTIEERDTRSTLRRETLATVHRVVEEALPASGDEAEGFDARPTDPIETFAFIGTRYAHRTTRRMVEALRSQGYDDLGILDLATAVADANHWARTHRLLGLAPELFYLHLDRGGGSRRGDPIP